MVIKFRTDLQNFYSFTVGIRPKFLILPGILMNPGSFALYPKTIFFRLFKKFSLLKFASEVRFLFFISRSGKWPKIFTTTKNLIPILMSWNKRLKFEISIFVFQNLSFFRQIHRYMSLCFLFSTATHRSKFPYSTGPMYKFFFKSLI